MPATVAKVGTTVKTKSFIQRIARQKILQLMVLPALILTIVFKYLPMFGSIIAFKDFNVFKGILASPWASSHGFEHFIDLFQDPYFPRVFINTLIIAFLKLTFVTFPPVILAVMLNEVQHETFKKVNQTISYLPHFLSWTVLGGIFYNLLDPTTGPVNYLLTSTGIVNTPIDFLYKPEYYRPIVVLTDIWKTIGWDSIIYLAVIASIDQSLYEALDMDGGGRWARIKYVIWPSLLGTFMILFIMKVGNTITGDGDMFSQSYVLGNYTNVGVSEILETYILKVGLDNARYSFAAAAGIFKSVINISALYAANTLSKKLTEKSLF